MSVLPDVPVLVSRALRKSLEMGYLHATRTETGRLLATLAASRQGTIAECGTGCGVGAAWLRSGAPPGTRVLTAELEGRLAHDVAEMFAADDIEVLHADWTALHDQAPFSLLLLEASQACRMDRGTVVDLLEPGGMAVVDDLIPSGSWSAGAERDESLRRCWLDDPRLAASEVLVAPDSALLLAVRRP